jgi:hypothetical protein
MKRKSLITAGLFTLAMGAQMAGGCAMLEEEGGDCDANYDEAHCEYRGYGYKGGPSYITKDPATYTEAEVDSVLGVVAEDVCKLREYLTVGTVCLRPDSQEFINQELTANGYPATNCIESVYSEYQLRKDAGRQDLTQGGVYPVEEVQGLMNGVLSAAEQFCGLSPKDLKNQLGL